MGPLSGKLGIVTRSDDLRSKERLSTIYCILDSNINNLFFFCVVKEKVEKENSIWYQNKNDLSSFV